MYFPGHSCPSNMIICSQPQTRGEGEGGRGRRRGCGNDVHRKTISWQFVHILRKTNFL